MEQIRAWLKQKGAFLAGVDLLRRFGHLPPDIIEASRKPFVSPRAKDRLIGILSELLANYDAAVAEAGPVEQPPPPARKSRAEEPDAIRALRESGKALLKEQAFLNARLGVLEDANDRYEVARRIVEEVTPEIDRIYNQIRAYEEEGTLPITEQDRDIVAETIAKLKRIDSLKTRIRQLKKSLPKTPEGPERMTVEQDISERQEELERLQSELGL